jgi:hypothetical protein
MILVAPLIAHLALAVTKTWYGPATASFATQFAGNQYDPVTNDVRVRFVSSEGKKLERPAYFSDGAWRADLVAEKPGEYTATLVRNGVELPDAPCTESMILVEDKLDHGYLHPDPDYPNRFLFDDGSPFVPVGHNLAWQTPGKMPTAAQISKMGENGLTWTRFWATEVDGRNPWWPINDPYALSQELWPSALDSLSAVAHACDISGLFFQLVLFDHVSLSTGPDGTWSKNPWNAANGGFLKSPVEFFTDSEAKLRTKMWLRYAVARYSSDPNLMSFELFDEIENTDAATKGHWPEIAAWTSEMATYLRSLDPYDHMLTTSSSLQHAELWKALDYYQPHLCALNPASAISSAQLPTDKPVFFGAIGDVNRNITRAQLRNCLYTSLFANTGGLPMLWDWDAAESEGLYPELATASKVIKASDIGHHPLLTRLTLSTTGCDARGVGSSGWSIARVIPTGSGPFSIQLGGLTVLQGPATVVIIDLDSGKISTSEQTISNARIALDLPGEDCIVVVTAKP